MVERGGGARFGLETPHELAIGLEARGEHLERDLTLQALLHRDVHVAHSTATDAPFDAVARDLRQRARRLFLARDGRARELRRQERGIDRLRVLWSRRSRGFWPRDDPDRSRAA
jgi:hypothetical protein